MNEFIRRHRAEVIGTLSGFDRLRIRGTLRLPSYVEGMLMYPGLAKALLKDFKAYALAATDQIRRATEQLAPAAGRPLYYLPSSRESKEAWARAVAERDGVGEELIGVLSCVEPCRSYEIHRNRQAKRLELRGGRLSWKVPLGKWLASAVTLGTGGSVGREGPMTLVGGPRFSRDPWLSPYVVWLV